MINQNSFEQVKQNANEYEILQQLFLEFLDEKNEIQGMIDINKDHIRENDCYLKTICEFDDVNIKVFSPRNTESLYKDKIIDNQNDRTTLENENKLLYKKLNIISVRIDKLKYVLDIIADEKSVKKVHQEDSNKTISINSDRTTPVGVDEITPEQEVNSDSNNLKDYPLDYKSIKVNILDIQEKERQRIARDLHDTTVQSLTHLIHKSELASKFMDQDILRSKLELAILNKNIKEIINEIRNTIFNLRPMILDDMGINLVLDRLKNILIERSNMKIVFSIDEIISQDELLLVTIFRSIQECCLNAIQHSGGQKLSVDLKYNNDNIEVTISDDGVGFQCHDEDSKNRHFGLSIVKERIFLLSGKIEISSRDPIGTCIIITIPHKDGKIYD